MALSRADIRIEPIAEYSSTQWSRLDWIVLAAVALIGSTLRFARLSTPGRIIFDESFYAQDACIYALSSRVCGYPGAVSEVSAEHPPFGKWLISAGIKIFGYSPFGWRVAAALAGTLSIVLLFVLARRLLGSTLGAAVAAGLLCFDLLHFVQSRIAMLDIFVLMFGLATLLCVHIDITAVAQHQWRGRRWHPWRLAAGLFGGMAFATKWAGIAFLATAVVLTLSHEMSGPVRGDSWRQRLRQVAPAMVVAFAVVPALVYVAAFIGRLPGSLFAWPWSDGSWLRSLAGRQRHMIRFHTSLADKTHPYASPAWAWPLLKRPIVYFFEESPGRYREILATGDPFIWWIALATLFSGAIRWVRRRGGSTENFVVVGFAFTYLPWLFITAARSFTFLFYFLQALPFLYLAVSNELTRVSKRLGVSLSVALAATTVGLFMFFLPVLSARSVTYEQWHRRILFQECGSRPFDQPSHTRATASASSLPADASSPPANDGQARPVASGAPPDGWCWI